MLASPRSPSSTTRIFSSAEKRRHVAADGLNRLGEDSSWDEAAEFRQLSWA
jgi:hypothetical protein